MALRTIRELGDPILRKNSKTVKEITERTAELIEDLKENVHAYDGVGLAAVQVGVLKKICVICIDPHDLVSDPEDEELLSKLDPRCHTDGKELIIINPEVTAVGEETQTGSEGCLSVPGKCGTVTRPLNVHLKAQDENLKEYELDATALLARAICHECDHMDGVVYVDLVEGELMDVNMDEEEEAE
ncbi:MAG: peptide deformylase [Parasporobacterium sp.]|nr:peptide deformylase [Parasporobacterium sp.]